MTPAKQMGRAEFNTATEIMRSAHELIHAVYPRRGEAPRSLINLTFLALEIGLKCHLKNLTGTYPRTHDLPELYAALNAHPQGSMRTQDIARAYASMMKHAKGNLPEYNLRFDTLDKLFALLTKKAFLEWRYFFELIEEQVASGKTDAIWFPFFNLYMVTWEFLLKAAETFGDGNFPRMLDYEKMPLWFRVTRQDPASSEIVWETFLSQLLMAKADPMQPAVSRIL